MDLVVLPRTHLQYSAEIKHPLLDEHHQYTTQGLLLIMCHTLNARFKLTLSSAGGLQTGAAPNEAMSSGVQQYVAEATGSTIASAQDGQRAGQGAEVVDV